MPGDHENFFNRMKKIMAYRLLLLPVLALLLGACATNHPRDPLEKFNRGMYDFNRTLDKAILKPMAEAYKSTVPEPVDIGISNFFNNLGLVTVFTNNLLQLKFKQASQDVGRFLLNAGVGFFGFFDPATEYGVPRHHEDFGQTLGYWGVPSGPYLVLPFLGPSTLRDGSGLVMDWTLDPISTNHDNFAKHTFYGINALKLLDTRADLLSAEKLLESVPDEYVFIRNAYLQRRDQLVRDGVDMEPLISDDELFGDIP
jgi:phospholipid-binding lipoprotein MlaA